MVADKYLFLDTSGKPKERILTDASAGAGDAGKGVALGPDGKLDPSLFPSSIGSPVFTYVASETLAAGDLVNLWNDAGTVKMRKADASVATKQAHGYVKSAVTSGASGSAYSEFGGVITGLSGLTGGSDYFLSATIPGGVTTAIPTTANTLVQLIGVAKSATELYFNPEVRGVRA
jgi:hypothetical protein